MVFPGSAAQELMGPAAPPREHPLWQGSVSSKWMDAASGKLRGRLSIASDAREGTDGVARFGFAGYYNDTHGKLRQEMSCNRAAPNPRPAPHGIEAPWRPSRRCVDPQPVREPDKLTSQPPFVHKTVVRLGREAKTFALASSWSAQHVGPQYDAELEGYHRRHMQQSMHHARSQAELETLEAKSLVAGLDAWEKEHVKGKSPGAALAARRREAAALLSPALGTSKSYASLGGTHTSQRQQPQQMLWRSTSDTSREFCRQRQAAAGF